jgi:hypothetical protein
MNPFLHQQLTRGDYVVDPSAVAEAMLSTMPRERSLGSVSRMLVALKRADRLIVSPEENGPRFA